MSNAVYADYATFKKEIVKLGEDEAAGKLKRGEFAVKLAVAARELGFGEDKAKEVWADFRSKVAKKLDGEQVDDEKSAGTRHSEVKQIIIAAVMPNVDLSQTLTRAKKLILEAKADGEAKGNMWDNMVKVARKQIKVPTANLSDAEIKEAIAPTVKDPKGEIEMLKAQIKVLEGIRDGKQPTEKTTGRDGCPSDELSIAIDALTDRVARLEYHAMAAKQAAVALKLGIK